MTEADFDLFEPKGPELISSNSDYKCSFDCFHVCFSPHEELRAVSGILHLASASHCQAVLHEVRLKKESCPSGTDVLHKQQRECFSIFCWFNNELQFGHY